MASPSGSFETDLQGFIDNDIKVINLCEDTYAGLQKDKYQDYDTRTGVCDQEWHIVPNAGRDADVINEMAMLFLAAPKPYRPLNLTKQQDEQARKKQFDHFYKHFTKYLDKDLYPSMFETVDKYQHISKALESFFKCQAANSKRALVIFNGHGSSEKDSNGRESGKICLSEVSVDNTVFLNDVHKIWKKLKRELKCEGGNSVNLPACVTVVFAHCYSYNYKQSPEQSQVITVKSLATPDNPQTIYAFTMDNSAVRSIQESVHLQLMEYAKTAAKEEKWHTVKNSEIPEADGEATILAFFLAISIANHWKTKTRKTSSTAMVDTVRKVMRNLAEGNAPETDIKGVAECLKVMAGAIAAPAFPLPLPKVNTVSTTGEPSTLIRGLMPSVQAAGIPLRTPVKGAAGIPLRTPVKGAAGISLKTPVKGAKELGKKHSKS